MSGFERRSLGGDAWAHIATRLEDAGFLAAFLERTGGSSAEPFDSLNVSFGVGDDPASVLTNRRAAASAFAMKAFAVPGLVHGTTLSAVGRGRRLDGFLGLPDAFAEADGLHTRTAGLALGGFSGDCVIAVMASPREGRVALGAGVWDPTEGRRPVRRQGRSSGRHRAGDRTLPLRSRGRGCFGRDRGIPFRGCRRAAQRTLASRPRRDHQVDPSRRRHPPALGHGLVHSM
jgi:hypothetical protein